MYSGYKDGDGVPLNEGDEVRLDYFYARGVNSYIGEIERYNDKEWCIKTPRHRLSADKYGILSTTGYILDEKTAKHVRKKKSKTETKK